MPKRVNSAEAKAHFATLIAEVAFGGQRYVIERRGKPLAALVRVEELDRLEQECGVSPRPRGALAIVGAWRDVGDKKLDALIADIYAQREKDTGRPVELEV